MHFFTHWTRTFLALAFVQHGILGHYATPILAAVSSYPLLFFALLVHDAFNARVMCVSIDVDKWTESKLSTIFFYFMMSKRREIDLKRKIRITSTLYIFSVDMTDGEIHIQWKLACAQKPKTNFGCAGSVRFSWISNQNTKI